MKTDLHASLDKYFLMRYTHDGGCMFVIFVKHIYPWRVKSQT